MKKQILWILAIVVSISMVAVFSFAGCKAEEEKAAEETVEETAEAEVTETEEAVQEEMVKIVIMPKLVGIDYYNAVKTGIDQAQEELKDVAEITWVGPTDAQVEKQIEMLETIIPTNPDVICVASNDPDAIVPVLEKASDAGIHVISWDGDANFREFFVNLVDYDAFGAAIIDSLAEQIGGEGDIAIVTTTFTAPNQVLWIEGIEKRIADKYPNIKIVDTRPAGEDTQKANQIAQDLIKTVPTLKGIIALGCPNVPGVIDAVKAADKVGEIFVVGNPTPNMIKPYLEEGSVKDAFLWSAPDHGYLTCYSAYRLVTEGLSEGVPFDAGKMGEFTPKADDISIQVSLPIVRFTIDNVGDYNF